MGTITFEVHPITLTSPSIHTWNHIKSILIFLLFIFLCIFFFLSKSCMGILEIKKKYPMMVSIWHSNFAIPKHTNVIDIALLLCRSIGVILWLAGNSGEMIIYAFPSKRVIQVLSTRNNLILLITNKEPKSSLA